MYKTKQTLVGKLSPAESDRLLAFFRDRLDTFNRIWKNSHSSMTNALVAMGDLDVENYRMGPCEIEKFRTEYLREEVFSKYVGSDTATPDQRRNRAIEKWLGTEQRNARTNVRIYTTETLFRGTVDGRKVSFSSEEVIEQARQIIRRAIGDDPNIEAVGNFSQGASTSLRRELGNAARKFTVQAHVTEQAWDLVWPEIYRHHAWMRLNPLATQPEFVRGNVLFTVPKTAEIDRVAAKEPDFNMWAQKRLGDELARHLRRLGIDLNNQGINQKLAETAYEKGLATLDLSSASDSVSRALVGRLLPPGWFVELNALRSPETLIDGEWHENAMFSSMGNGFTFELESLIFYSICRAVCALLRVRGRVSVYGDDLIVPSKVVRILTDVLGWCGFLVNPKKSHWLEDDWLRESCGSHWFYGFDVKPFYVKGPLLTQEDLIHMLNKYRRWIDVEPFSDTGAAIYHRETWWKMAMSVDKRLWGGRDLSRKDRLVTPHEPRWMICRAKLPKKQLMEELQHGLYLHALRSGMYRTTSTDSEATILVSEGPPTLRRRPLSYWESVLPTPSW